ncbi:MAG: membrane protein insertion efficiency factor YidD [Desulfatibacillaceae bacterium]
MTGRRLTAIRICVALALILTAGTAAAGDAMRGPWEAPDREGETNAGEAPGSFGLSFMYEGYAEYVSPIDGARCPMHPSCSAYARQALARHGPLVGWIMASDRLLRCGRSELSKSPRVWSGTEYLCHDPVSANDFWWSGKAGRVTAR